ncbi:MAG: Type 1 glutamine amidotransferase-like domain-containing protein [Candidatus Micrarchaeota archaeon]|nr:Type 1 glutamine amidotransferase-like domain-containing protein [Candidatus Micrarchaeota archaeon]
MKLMLTSSGITNKSLEKALKGLVRGRIRIAFIPTAANLEEGEKDWLIENFNQCQKIGPTDIVDISAMPKGEWLPRLKAANVIFVGGGWTAYLVKWIRRSGLEKELPKLLKKRVYVGISAGSIALCKRLSATPEYLYGEDINDAPPGLGYVDFNFRPHLNSPYFPKVRDANLRKSARRLDGELYALDDNSGIVWVDGKINVVSEGKWKKY